MENESHIDIHTQELEVDEIMKDVFADHVTVKCQLLHSLTSNTIAYISYFIDQVVILYAISTV